MREEGFEAYKAQLIEAGFHHSYDSHGPGSLRAVFRKFVETKRTKKGAKGYTIDVELEQAPSFYGGKCSIEAEILRIKKTRKHTYKFEELDEEKLPELIPKLEALLIERCKAIEGVV